MSNIFDDYDDDEDVEDIIEEFNDSEEDDDAFEALEYLHNCQIMSDDEIISDIRSYLKKYHPQYKIVRRRD